MRHFAGDRHACERAAPCVGQGTRQIKTESMFACVFERQRGADRLLNLQLGTRGKGG